MERAITPTLDVSDSGKVKIGGGGMYLRKPTPKKQPDVSDNGKVKIGGGGMYLRKPTPKEQESSKAK